MTPITIRDIEVIDASGNVTAAGTRLMELIHEGMGMGCWHKPIWNPGMCKVRCRCGILLGTPDNWMINTNPSYLTSLDPWRSVWDKMSHEQKLKHAMWLHDIMPSNSFPFEAQPHHHAEALAGMIKENCEECLDRKNRTGKCNGCHIASFLCDDLCSKALCSICDDTTKNTLLDSWVKEMEVKGC